MADRTVVAGGAVTEGFGESLRLGRFFIIAAELALFVAVIYQLNLESPAFLQLSILTFFGWSVHYFLPHRYRLLFFVVLSFLAIELIFSKAWDKWWQGDRWWYGDIGEGAWLVAIGLGLIGLCHLPVRFAWRVAALIAVGAVLAAARAGWISVPWSEAIWPVLASMFMFRIIVYLYEVRHEKKPVTLLERLAYFFMLPNVCFPLFPVVDFQTFRRTYYDKPDRHEIYQTGIHWLFRGALHLILYRLVYQNFVIDAAEVQDRRDLVQFLLWPFLLYLRVSGTFHLITGLLHLFGFNLPETHKLYFLSSSFTDFWRRINIYWKDFIMKIFYYPLYFKLRRFGETTALIIATLLAFLITWLLHSYQWFWLRGTLIFTLNDFLFWMILAILVTANALYEMRRGRTRRLQGQALSWDQALTTALKTIGVFFTISVLWSFWSAGSIREWLSVFQAASVPSTRPGNAMLLLAATVLALAVPAAALARGTVDRPYEFARSAAAIIIPAILVLGASFSSIHAPFGTAISTAIASVKNSELNRRDFANFERGYYENLLDVGGFSSELWKVYGTRPKDWIALEDSALVRHTGSLPVYELLPLAEEEFHGIVVHTNRWAMRDQEYDKTRAAMTLRIALIGASHVFGSGVGDNETFETLVEARLNREATGGQYERYELLNFGVGGYSALECLAILEDKVLDFAPDYMVFFEHSGAPQGELPDLVTAIQNGAALRFDFVQELFRELGIDPKTDSDRLRNILYPHKERILRAIYGRLVELTRARHIPAVWVYLPRVREQAAEGSPEIEMRLAQEAGFTILDLSGVYDGQDPALIEVAPWDNHPNAIGHRLIAEKLYRVLLDNQDKISLDPAASRASTPAVDDEATN